MTDHGRRWLKGNEGGQGLTGSGWIVESVDRCLIEKQMPTRCHNITLAHTTHLGLSMLGTLREWSCFALTSTLWSRYYYYHLQIANKKSEAMLLHDLLKAAQIRAGTDPMEVNSRKHMCNDPVRWEETCSKAQWGMSMLELRELPEAKNEETGSEKQRMSVWAAWPWRWRPGKAHWFPLAAKSSSQQAVGDALPRSVSLAVID